MRQLNIVLTGLCVLTCVQSLPLTYALAGGDAPRVSKTLQDSPLTNQLHVNCDYVLNGLTGSKSQYVASAIQTLKRYYNTPASERGLPKDMDVSLLLPIYHRLESEISNLENLPDDETLIKKFNFPEFELQPREIKDLLKQMKASRNDTNQKLERRIKPHEKHLKSTGILTQEHLLLVAYRKSLLEIDSIFHRIILENTLKGYRDSSSLERWFWLKEYLDITHRVVVSDLDRLFLKAEPYLLIPIHEEITILEFNHVAGLPIYFAEIADSLRYADGGMLTPVYSYTHDIKHAVVNTVTHTSIDMSFEEVWSEHLNIQTLFQKLRSHPVDHEIEKELIEILYFELHENGYGYPILEYFKDTILQWSMSNYENLHSLALEQKHKDYLRQENPMFYFELYQTYRFLK